jgi:cell division protein FtsI (penicillin-binding protein 3)
MVSFSFKLAKFRGVITLGILVAGYLGVLSKLYILQIVKGDYLKKQALAQHRPLKKIPNIRGTIYDRNLRELALSVDMDSVYMNPSQVEGGLKSIAKLLKIPRRKLEKKARSDKSFVWVKRKILPEQAKALKKYAVKGIHTVVEGKRFYPRRELAGHLLGFAGLDHRGLEGVELAYESYLAEGEGLRGHDVKLTLDETIQFITEEALAAACVKHRAGEGQALVMDPATGHILAMAIYPRFDPNRFRSAKAGRWRNRCLTDGFEPGSIMKVFLAAAALEEGLFFPDQPIFCRKGTIKIKGATIHDQKPYGWLKFREIMEKSSNVGAVKIGMRLGKKRLYDYLSQFGFGEKTGIGLPGENPGILRYPNEWAAGSTAYHSIGQGVSVTSIQFLRAFCAIANGGTLLDPRIVEEIWDPETGASLDFSAKHRMRRVVSEQTCRKLTSILQGAVERGTGKGANIDGYTVAGKTGTAQKFDTATGKYFKNRYVASFVGFTPVSSPRLAVLVAIDEPKGRYYHGGEAAAPVFARIARQTLEYLQVAPDKKNNTLLADSRKPRFKATDSPGRAGTSSPDSSAVRNSGKTRYGVMPDLYGKSMREAIRKLSGGGIHMKMRGSGFAVSQHPASGKKIPAERICTVWFKPPAQ